MTYSPRLFNAPHTKSSTDLRTQAAIDRLLSQQRLTGIRGFQIRLSNQNQVYLNTERPTRVGVPAAMLEKAVLGFKAGMPSVLKVTYLERDVVAYHSYSGRDVWIPTAPKKVGSPGDILTLRIEQLRLLDFLDQFPMIELVNEGRLAWFADLSRVRVSKERSRIRLSIEQDPPAEADSPRFVLEGRLLGRLECKAGVVFTDFELVDAFGMKNELRLYATDKGVFGLGVRQGRSVLPVVMFSSDGARLRIAYNYSKGVSSVTLYLENHSRLYSLGKLRRGPSSLKPEGSSHFYQVSDVTPTRELELSLIKHSNNYEHGRIGAEIANAIVVNRLGYADLILAEPAKGGKDLYSKDGRVVVQSRLLVNLPESWWKKVILRQFAQMVRKLNVDFRYTSGAKVGYAVLSFSDRRGITSLIAEVLPRRV